MTGPAHDLREALGPIDVYLLDQIMRGRFDGVRKILDAGCGGGRNLVWFLRNGFDVFGADESPDAVRSAAALAAGIAPAIPASNFTGAEISDLPFEDGSFDAVLSIAVLHFCKDEDHFAASVREMWRVLRPGGLFFARLASDIGIEDRVRRIEGRWHHLPDGSDRFLADEKFLTQWTRELGAEPLDPIKTVNVQGMRCMTNWCMRKR